jgi:hypothetical protein
MRVKRFAKNVLRKTTWSEEPDYERENYFEKQTRELENN